MDPDYGLFARIVAAGSLSAVAREIHLSPAMVSKRLSRLEERLGTRLIHRSTRKLTTTEVGQAFYEDVIAILAAARAAEARVAGRADAPSGRLRIAAPTSFGRMHIAPHLAAFLDANPKLKVELLLADQFADLLSERLDVAIRITPQPETGLAFHLLAPNRRVLCAAPSYITSHGEPEKLEDLRHHHLLAATNQSPWRLENPKGIRVVEVDSRVRTNSSEVIRELAIAGAGVALRSTWDINTELKSGKLVHILPEWHGAASVGIYAVRPPTSLVPINVKTFVAFLSSLYGSTPYWEIPKGNPQARQREKRRSI